MIFSKITLRQFGPGIFEIEYFPRNFWVLWVILTPESTQKNTFRKYHITHCFIQSQMGNDIRDPTGMNDEEFVQSFRLGKIP